MQVKNLSPDLGSAVLVHRQHAASGGVEHFISFEVPGMLVLVS
jgi:hypothetical protein